MDKTSKLLWKRANTEIFTINVERPLAITETHWQDVSRKRQVHPFLPLFLFSCIPLHRCGYPGFCPTSPQHSCTDCAQKRPMSVKQKQMHCIPILRSFLCLWWVPKIGLTRPLYSCIDCTCKDIYLRNLFCTPLTISSCSVSSISCCKQCRAGSTIIDTSWNLSISYMCFEIYYNVLELASGVKYWLHSCNQLQI